MDLETISIFRLMKKIDASTEQHVGTGCKLVNVTAQPEAIDEAERNWLNHSMTWGWRQCVSCLEFNFSSSLLQHDSRKPNDVSLLNSISRGTDHFSSRGENTQTLQYLKLLLFYLLMFTVFLNKESKRVYLHDRNSTRLSFTATFEPILAIESTGFIAKQKKVSFPQNKYTTTNIATISILQEFKDWWIFFNRIFHQTKKIRYLHQSVQQLSHQFLHLTWNR